jgi:hypothetical protein
MKFIYSLLFSVVVFISFQNASAQQTNTSSTPQMKSTAQNYTYKIIDAANKTFGYAIYADGKLFINQPSIPGLPGNNGFKTKKEAIKIALLVIAKIKRGEMPPSITKEEMKKEGITL